MRGSSRGVGLWFAPLLLALLSIPLALGMIEPNGLYGIRTDATGASERAWYAGNRAGGIAGIVGGLGALLINRRLLSSSLPHARKLALCAASIIAAALIMGIAGTLAARAVA